MSPPGKYIYGIIEEPAFRTFSFCGIGGAEVYTINQERLAAVVSDTGLTEIDPSRRNVLAHTTVQDMLLKEYTLLPMTFGMIAGGVEQVRRLLEANYQALAGEIRRLAGKIEIELKVFWDRAAMIEALQGGNRELDQLRSKIKAAPSPLEAQRLLVEAGRLVEGVVLDWRARYARLVYAMLKALSLETQLNQPLGVQNILNAAFLIDRARESQFQQEVHRLDAQYQGKVNFKYVGPLPPYSFVNVKLEAVR